MSIHTNNLYTSWKELKKDQILAVNCGSSSIKVTLFEHEKKAFHRLFDANLNGLNTDTSELEITSANGKEIINTPKDLKINERLKFTLETLSQKFNFSLTSILGIGHRFVHGGDQYTSSVCIDSKIITDLEKLSELAPLHNEACLNGIKECYNLVKKIPQVAVFDTAFHHTLPPVAANYAIPRHLREKYSIKRYGFHGISNAFLWNTYKEHVGENLSTSKIITLHLGSGCSITAISGGISMDTSMGFTPDEGLVMATRAGDIDASIVEFICRHENKTPSEVMEILNSHSGLLGISGISSNIETLLDQYHKNEMAKLAVDMFCYRIVKYLGAYIAVLGGAHAVVFSGGIGENSPIIREQILSKMDWHGVKIDEKANNQAIKLNPGNIKRIGASDSSVSLYVVATDENYFIAQEVQRLL